MANRENNMKMMERMDQDGKPQQVVMKLHDGLGYKIGAPAVTGVATLVAGFLIFRSKGGDEQMLRSVGGVISRGR